MLGVKTVDMRFPSSIVGVGKAWVVASLWTKRIVQISAMILCFDRVPTLWLCGACTEYKFYIITTLSNLHTAYIPLLRRLT